MNISSQDINEFFQYNSDNFENLLFSPIKKENNESISKINNNLNYYEKIYEEIKIIKDGVNLINKFLNKKKFYLKNGD